MGWRTERQVGQTGTNGNCSYKYQCDPNGKCIHLHLQLLARNYINHYANSNF